jgi:hypothetical protein
MINTTETNLFHSITRSESRSCPPPVLKGANGRSAGAVSGLLFRVEGFAKLPRTACDDDFT